MKFSSIAKTFFGICLLAIAGMLYWSSELQEQDLKYLRLELKELRTEMAALSQKLSKELHTIKLVESKEMTASQGKEGSHAANLLESDPYIEHVLPEALPKDFKPSGILKRAMIGRPENLHPFNGFRDVSLLIDMCGVQVADLKTGCYETLAPKMAYRMEKRASSEDPTSDEYWIFLRDDVYWEPLEPRHFPASLQLAEHFRKRHKVTAHDFKFFYDAVMNPFVHEAKAASLRTYFNDIEDFRVLDDSTFVVRWKAFPTSDGSKKAAKYTSLGITGSLQPLPSFVFQYFADGQKIVEDDSDPDIYRKDLVWAQNFAHHWAKNVIVSCGAYLFDGMNDEGIILRRNPHYFEPHAVLVEGIKYTFKESVDAAWQDFKSGKIDLCNLSPNQLLELESFLKSPEYLQQKQNNQGIASIDYVDLSYYYIGWNQQKPFFNDLKIRKALSMAIDRNRIIEQNLNHMGVAITGPFFRYSPSYDEQVAGHPYNPEESRRLLEEAGWVDIDGDGIRDKYINGEKVSFKFKLCYYIKSLSTKVIAEYVATALKTIGIQCELCGLDITDLARNFEDKNFDAIFMGWKLGSPPEDPRQLWHSTGANEKGSSNAIGFMHPKVDQIIDELHYEYDKKKRMALYHEFHRIIHEEAPYAFLYTPKVRLLYREYLNNVFIPRERHDLIPNADISEPNLQHLWITK